MGLSTDGMKFTHDSIMDNGLNYYTNADQLLLCEDLPADYAAATTDKGSGGNALAEDTPTFTGPANGDSSGRKITVDAISDVAIDVTGYCDYVALVNDDASELLLAVPQPYSAITGVDTGTDTFTISGDHTSSIDIDADVTVRISTGNNGNYTVSSVSLNGSNTDVVVNESVSDSTVDGQMIYGAFKVTSGGKADIASFDDEIADVN